MRRKFAIWIYRIIRPYMKVDKYKNPHKLSLQFSLNIFGERIAEIEYTDYELMERIILSSK